MKILGEDSGVRKVPDGSMVWMRSDYKESQEDLFRPSNRAIKWQRKFMAEKCKVIFMEKETLVHYW